MAYCPQKLWYGQGKFALDHNRLLHVNILYIVTIIHIDAIMSKAHMSKSMQNTISASFPSLVAFAIAIISTVGLTTLLYAKAEARKPVSNTVPRPVAVTPFVMQDHYRRSTRYLGVVVASNSTNLGFEVSGKLSEAPPREGTQVEQGEVLAKLDTRALKIRRNALRAQLGQVDAELELAKLRAQRQQRLVSGGAVSQQNADETRLQAKALSARRKAVQAELAALALELEKTELRAPFTGTVAERYVSQGTVVSAGTPVLRLIERGRAQAHIGVPAELAHTLKIGESYSLQVADKRLSLALLGLRADINAQTRAATAVFELPADIQAFSGEAVSLHIGETLQAHGGWLPISALLEGERGLWNVLRIQRRDGKDYAEREVVEVIELADERVFVRGTLDDGDLVVNSGLNRVTPGAQVTLLPASDQAELKMGDN